RVLGRLGFDGLDEDHVVGRKDLGRIFWRRTDLRILERLLRPLELLHGNAPGRVISEADAGALGVGAQHHRETPADLTGAWRQGERGELRPPFAADIDVPEGAAIAVTAIVSDETV